MSFWLWSNFSRLYFAVGHLFQWERNYAAFNLLTLYLIGNSSNGIHPGGKQLIEKKNLTGLLFLSNLCSLVLVVGEKNWISTWTFSSCIVDLLHGHSYMCMHWIEDLVKICVLAGWRVTQDDPYSHYHMTNLYFSLILKGMRIWTVRSVYYPDTENKIVR